jgi:hypothetical protein
MENCWRKSSNDFTEILIQWEEGRIVKVAANVVA